MATCGTVLILPPPLHIVPSVCVLPAHIVHAYSPVRVAAAVGMLFARFVVLLIALCLLRSFRGLALAEAVADLVCLVCGG
jgi:hypothetical protein